MSNSFLVNGLKGCDSLTANCTPDTNPNSGELSLSVLSQQVTVNMDQSDTVEISGSCVDLGRLDNRIYVEVFAGTDETVDPYIKNEITSNCYSIAGAGIITSSGINSNDKCFWITKGPGLIVDPGLPSQKDFPQCNNGQFGFSVKLGKILTDPALGTTYTVRMKLHSDTSGVPDGTWTRVSVSRGLSAPRIVSSVPDDLATFTCDIKNSLARFNSNLAYTLTRTYKLAGGGPSPLAAINLPGFLSKTSTDLTAFDYQDGPMTASILVEGVTYNYSLKVTEAQYAPYAPAPIPSTANSAISSCAVPKPILSQYTAVAPIAGECNFYLSTPNFGANVRYHISYKQQAGWAANPTTSPPDISCAAGAGLGTLQSGDGVCHIRGLTSGQTYYFNVRAYRDISPTNLAADLATEEVGIWSNEINCRPP